MKSLAGTLAAPFPWFGGKALACEAVWAAFGDVDNYVEPFAGSAAMLLGAPDGKRVETINDADGFVANFWRAVSHDAEAVAAHADWPTNEADLFARHSWLVRPNRPARPLPNRPKRSSGSIAGSAAASRCCSSSCSPISSGRWTRSSPE